MKRLVLYPVLAALAVICFVGSAFAADAVTPSTTVDVSSLLAVVMPYVAAAVAGLVSLILTDLWLFTKKKWGIDIDASQRDAIQTALTQGAGLLIAKGAHLADGKTIDVKNPAIKAGVDYVLSAVPEALAHYGLGANDVAAKLVAKIGAMTAPATAVEGVAAPAPTAAPAAA